MVSWSRLFLRSGKDSIMMPKVKDYETLDAYDAAMNIHLGGAPSVGKCEDFPCCGHVDGCRSLGGE